MPKDWRQIAAAIDLRVRQLTVQGVSDSILVNQMLGYMGELHQLWTSTTDDELWALCQEFPGFVRYATLMEGMSEALRIGVGVPAGIKQLPPAPEHLKRELDKLLSTGAAIERGLQQLIDESSAGRFNATAMQSRTEETRILHELYRQWRSASTQFLAEMRASDLPGQMQELTTQVVETMVCRIDSLHKQVVSPYPPRAFRREAPEVRFSTRMQSLHSFSCTFGTFFLGAEAL